jgi:hypothetical protein
MGCFHLKFPKMYNWQLEFEKMNTANKRIFFTLHITLIILFFGFTALSFIYYNELAIPKGLAIGLNLFYSIFWLWRACWQIIYFKPPKEMKKHPMAKIGYVLTVIFLILFVSYLMPVVLSL